jgi:two-component system OmpR family sensor kinase
MVLLVAVVCLIFGVVTEIALHAFLIGQFDQQLSDASYRARGAAPSPRPDRPVLGHRPAINASGQGSGTVVATLVGGNVRDAQRLSSTGQPENLPANLYPVLAGLPVNGGPTNRALGDLGEYRLTATLAPSDGDVVITGLPLSTVDNTQWTVGWILGGVSLIALVVAAGAGTLIVRRTLRPLQRVAATAGRVVELPLDRGEVPLSVRVPDADTDPRTEVGQVGAALNRMLGHIGNALAVRHASETRVRQFVADASHELRTPLAAIRGYAELTRRSRDEVPEDVAYAMSRVESESARMTTLVEDLLLLARLDSGRPLETEQVDLSRLVVDAVNDARIAGRDHLWRLDLPAEPVTVTGDTQRLHQVLANLLANARTHTPTGTTVTTSVRRLPDRVLLSVADNGPGIPAELMPEVFERFARGERSRSRAAGSTGLGLAIVAAVVAAHRGTVEVTSAPGRTVFTVTLPA